MTATTDAQTTDSAHATGRPALVVATVLTSDGGDYAVEVRNEQGGTVAGPLVVDVAIRPGDEALNITPDGLRWRTLNEAARALGVTIAGWHTIALERFDGAVYVANVVAPYPLPPVVCEPWCLEGDGHTGERIPADQTCEGPGFHAAGHVVYLERRPGEQVRLHIDHVEGAPVLDLPPSLARDLAAAILESASDAP